MIFEGVEHGGCGLHMWNRLHDGLFPHIWIFFPFFFLVSRKSKTRSSLFYDLIMDSRTPPLSDLQPFFFFLLATGGGWGWDSCVPR